MGEQLWEVIGGAATGGILVREDVKLNSAEVNGRLAVGSIVRQVELIGERLKYELVSGSGPSTGWISLAFKGKALVSKFVSLLLKPKETQRILFLPIPWKGHFIHERRLAEWFSGRSGYEVHFSYWPSNIKDIPPKHDNLFFYPAEGEVAVFDDFFAEAQDTLANFTKGAGSDMIGVMMKSMARAALKGQDVLSLMGGYVLKTMLASKPHLVVTEFMADIMTNGVFSLYCKAHGTRVLYINAPGVDEGNLVSFPDQGIPEFNPKGLMEGTLMKAPEGDNDEELNAVLKTTGLDQQEDGFLKDLAAHSLAVLTDEEQAAFAGVSIDMLKGKGDPMAAKMPEMLTGMLAAQKTMPPQAAGFLNGPIAKKLGIKPALWGKMKRAGEDPANDMVSPIMHPSPPVVVPTPGAAKFVEDLSIFAGQLVGLPAPHENGHVQRSRNDGGLDSIPSDLLDWIFAGDDSVPIIYLAFGTMVRPSKELFVALGEALNSGNWRVLWALPKDVQHLKPENLDPKIWRVESFVPQADVLKCDRIRCFISHCGMNSSCEALASGVPVICCPFYMDQYHWTQAICSFRKAGLFIDKIGATAAHIRQAVQLVLSEPAYRENARICSQTMHNQEKAIMSRLGPEMAPAKGLGVGTSVAAALIMQHLQNPIKESNGEVRPEFYNLNAMIYATAAEATKGSEPLRELPAFEFAT
mmetsp:Transcript_24437/g.55314  ORF Transcript_24437/g.55314 Transcript_24437/m.55314 type:complete len:694 (+) Transcript_24437:34-2115(+)